MTARSDDGVRVPAAELARRLDAACSAQAIDLAGAVPLRGPSPHAADWFAWLDGGRHGRLAYLQATRDERADPRLRNPWARSLLVFAQRYTDGWPAADEVAGDWLPLVARYARGLDYHDVLLRAVKRVLHDLRAVWPDLVARPAVDTGPYLERDWAAAAGLGFIGKNTCLIHERLGSGLLLAVAPTNLELADPAGAPHPLFAAVERGPLPRAATDRCAGCARCLDACPTGALVAPRLLDAGRCLATWSIEWQGRAPAGDRAAQGDRLFGCDVCQRVCPWNEKAARRTGAPWGPSQGPPSAYAPLPGHGSLTLRDLCTLDGERFRALFRRTPLWRTHPAGSRRNALVVAANTGRVDLLAVVREAAHADGDPEIRAVAAWALARLEEGAQR